MEAINASNGVQDLRLESDADVTEMLKTFEEICDADLISKWHQESIRKSIMGVQKGQNYDFQRFNEIARGVTEYLQGEKGFSHEICNKAMALFLKLLSLWLAKGDKITHWSTIWRMHTAFSQTEKYFALGRPGPAFLLEIHKMALEVCKQLIEKGSLGSKMRDCLFNTIPPIANHHDWSADAQREIFQLGLEHADDPSRGNYRLDKWVDLVLHFAQMEYSSPCVRAEAVRLLCSAALNSENSLFAREKIIGHFPLSNELEEVSDDLRRETFHVLEKILKESGNPLKLRVVAAQHLSLFPWAKKAKPCTSLDDLEERAVAILLNQLNNECTPKEIRKTIATTLFYRMGAAPDEDPALQRLAPILTELFEDPKIPDWLREELARQFPKKTDYVRPSSKVSRELRDYMQQAVTMTNLSPEVNLVFEQHIGSMSVWNSSFPFITPLSADNDDGG